MDPIQASHKSAMISVFEDFASNSVKTKMVLDSNASVTHSIYNLAH